MAICDRCGGWTEPPVVREAPTGPVSVCPYCGHHAPFARYPLWVVTGSAGAGKSALAPRLRRRLPGWIVFEGEAIDFWRFEAAPGDYSSLHNQWLKVAYEIALNGPSVVLVATATPAQLDAGTFRCRFSTIHCLGLVCDETVQAARLRARPAWRQAAAPDFVARALGFTRHLRELAQQPAANLTLLDTTGRSPADSATQAAAWARAHQPAPP